MTDKPILSADSAKTHAPAAPAHTNTKPVHASDPAKPAPVTTPAPAHVTPPAHKPDANKAQASVTK
jgi:hypothetical protein